MASFLKKGYSWLHRFSNDGNFRAFCRLAMSLRNVPRYLDRHVIANGIRLWIPDVASFLSAYREIFVNRIYAFYSCTEQPRILDLGANIGLSVLFFKSIYPASHITAFEPDPYIYRYLTYNISSNKYNDVELINKAAWNENAVLEFHPDKADSGRIAQGSPGHIQVNAIDIAGYLRNHHVDFLKMDIEGAEEVVLPACKEYLGSINYLFVEYHSQVGKKQTLDDIIHVMTESGFRVHIHSPVIFNPSPFLNVKSHCGFDLQLNIFGWRSREMDCQN
jgi:FkbM family methyltransferase